MPPAFADEYGAVACDGAESVAQSAGKLADRARLRIEPQQPAGPAELHQIARPVADIVQRRSIGCDQPPVGRGRQRIDGVQPLRKGGPGCLGRGVVVEPDLHAAERDGKATTGQGRQRGDRPLEAANRRCRVSGQTRQPRAIGDEQRGAVRGEILRRVAFEQDLRLLERLVGLQRPVERRHGDSRLATAEEAVGEFSDSDDHDGFPQRLSY
ncbi:hypothetical protein [Bradyrhizobium ottawaense]|uniref:hypothetical protein n=1 Tax=Bradyrhizobium ottawaense TaxID=931866 RepID=UPI0035162DB3